MKKRYKKQFKEIEVHDMRKNVNKHIVGIQQQLDARKNQNIENKILSLIDKCFKLGQGGYNQAEDKEEYIIKATKFAKELNLIS
jgi:hypothetical protein